MDLKIVDIVNDREQMLATARLAAIHHPENFSKFEGRMYGYTNFFTVYLNDELVAISGIWQAKTWPSNYYRVGDRSFYFPSIRQYDLSNPAHKPYKTLNSQHLIPMQTKIVMEKDGFPFYSMLNHPNALRRSVSLHNEVSEYKYKVLDGLYWTCHHTPNPKEKSCWQNIAVLENYSHCELPKYE